jgi:hypothetical protein
MSRHTRAPRPVLFSAVGLAVLGMVAVGLAGCGGDDQPAPGVVAPLHYDYLTKLRLNVGSIDIQDNAQPLGPDDVSAKSPVTPDQALHQIAQDRLFAAGLVGRAQFAIDQASIVRGAQGGLYGQMAVHLEVTDAGGARVGYAEARVAQSHLPGSGDENLPTVLYDMTRKMADQMNVELEYQLKRSMGGFLAAASVVPSAVTAAPLAPSAPGPAGLPLAAPGFPPESGGLAPPGAPGADPLAPPPGAVQMVPATPGASAPPPGLDNQGAPPPQMSPPPGYLQLPSESGQ